MSNKSVSDDAGEALRMAVSRFLVPIQTTRVVDEEAFRTLHEEALNLVRAFKGQKRVPKALLLELLGSYSILRSEAPYFGAKQALLESMADKIEICFRMILADEVPGERQSGVPRIM